VVAVLEIVRREIDLALALLGCTSVADVDASIARA
jgi:isopentenyl diphosphate isomerase/L-lactate dehydrogenase-like FMN-dependent dehydrogenase